MRYVGPLLFCIYSLKIYFERQSYTETEIHMYRETERDTEVSSICWFCSQMAVVARDGPGQNGGPEASSMSPMLVQGPSVYLSRDLVWKWNCWKLNLCPCEMLALQPVALPDLP